MAHNVTGRQIAAARTLIGMTQPTLAALSNISVPTLKRMEGSDGRASGLLNNVAAVIAALEASGIEFLNHGQPGVRMKANEMALAVTDSPTPTFKKRGRMLKEDLRHDYIQSRLSPEEKARMERILRGEAPPLRAPKASKPE